MPLFRLKLDHNNVYWAAEPVDVSDVCEGDVVLDHEPDNTPGRYRWDAEAKALVALPPSQVKLQPGVPSFEEAFADVLDVLEAAGQKLPARAKAWRDGFKRTIDEVKG